MFGSPTSHERVTAKLLRRTVAALALCAVVSLQSGCRAEQPWPLWQAYRAKFLESSGRIVDRSAGDRTTSEGMAYAMFFALVTNDRSSFDKLLQWTEDNLAGGDLTARLPSWNWGKSSAGEWKTLDPNSASDADLWMAYDLLEAGRLWQDNRLEKLGQVMTDRIAHSEVALTPSLGTVLLPGPSGFHPNQSVFVLNPSYTPPQVLARLRQASPQGPWGSVTDALPSLLQGGSSAGFAMDWVGVGSGVSASATPAELAADKKDAVPVGSYDAIRVYLWLGMADKSTAGVSGSLASVSGMGRYLRTAVLPPLLVDATGKVLQEEGTVGFSAAVIPYLRAVGQKKEADAQSNRLQASLDSTSGLYGRSTEYYDQNLALFSTGWQEGRFRFEKDGRLKVKWK